VNEEMTKEEVDVKEVLDTSVFKKCGEPRSSVVARELKQETERFK
jgi:hypothetical protein